jgi:hypothetical protein
MGFGLVNRFIDYLHVVTTNIYNTITDFHTTNHSTLSLLSIPSRVTSVCIRRFQVMNLSHGDFSTSVSRWLTVHKWTLNCTVAQVVFKINPRHGPRIKPNLYCWWGVFTTPLHSNGSYPMVACVFVGAGMCFPSRWLVMKVYYDFTIPAFRRHVTIYIFLM